ncbi:MAG: Lrp/AsnC family transcriptional regulator [archaeon]|nr:winged helix-turn-helix transcriptional regulator [Candidatus Bathyarchaeum sp.]
MTNKYANMLQRGVKVIQIQLDELDKKILIELLKDARKKFTDIAKNFDVSTSNIKKRYSKLVKMGIIKNSTVVVNAKKLGFQGHLSLYVNVKHNEEKKFMDYVKQIKGATTYYVELNENYNVHVLLPVKRMDEIEERKQQIKNHPTVISLKANIWTNIELFPENLSMLE